MLKIWHYLAFRPRPSGVKMVHQKSPRNPYGVLLPKVRDRGRAHSCETDREAFKSEWFQYVIIKL